MNYTVFIFCLCFGIFMGLLVTIPLWWYYFFPTKIKSYDKAKEFLENVKNKKRLIRIAIKSRDCQPGNYIVKNKITNENDLYRIALKAKSPSTREDAAQKITDQVKLQSIFRQEQISEVRKKVIEKIEDQDFLRDVVMNDLSSEVRIAALKKITDQNFIKNIAKEDNDIEVRLTAIPLIEDIDLLKSYAQTDSEERIRARALVNILHEQDIVIDRANNDVSLFVRKTAMEYIEDDTIKRHSILNNQKREPFINDAFIRNCQDQLLINELGKILTDEQPLEYIIYYINDVSSLENIISKKVSSEITIRSKRKICELIGHIRNGCKCERCDSAHDLDDSCNCKVCRENFCSGPEEVLWNGTLAIICSQCGRSL